MKLVLIFLGGGMGAASRYLLADAVNRLAGLRFPMGILTCNLLGCLLIGTALGYASKSAPSWFGPLMIVGFLGGFTTYSTYAADTLALIRENLYLHAAGNILLTTIPGLLAVLLGLRISA